MINSSKCSEKLFFHGSVEIYKILLCSGFSTTATARNYSHILEAGQAVVLVPIWQRIRIQHHRKPIFWQFNRPERFRIHLLAIGAKQARLVVLWWLYRVAHSNFKQLQFWQQIWNQHGWKHSKSIFWWSEQARYALMWLTCFGGVFPMVLQRTPLQAFKKCFTIAVQVKTTSPTHGDSQLQFTNKLDGLMNVVSTLMELQRYLLSHFCMQGYLLSYFCKSLFTFVDHIWVLSCA